MRFLHEKDVNQDSIEYPSSNLYEPPTNPKPIKQKINKSNYQKVQKNSIVSDYKTKDKLGLQVNSDPISLADSPEIELVSVPKAKDNKKKKEEIKRDNNTEKKPKKLIEVIERSFAKNSQPPETTADFYRAGKVLGKGAFGKVSLALHKLSKKLVALKLLNKEFLKNETSKEKVMQEVRILKRFRHPNVVKLFETFESIKHIVVVMELWAGGDLLNYVRKRRRLKESYAKYIFKQIIEGIAHIHSKGVLHRDIKLDNILLDGKGNIKIGDFGVSRIITNINDKMTEQWGTPAYIAPEILRDKGYYGFAWDLWSAGVVLYAMLYGTVPFKASNMNDLHKLIMKGKYTLKDDISDEARDLLK